jgi:hypothetical protein
MAVNYYDQFQPLTYNPMTLQEMLIGPQMMQQKHDQYQALLDQEGLFDVPALEVDKPGVQQWMDKYKENINDLSDQLLRSGYNKDLSRRARQILQEKQQAISSRGYLGRASQAYQQYLKNVEDEKKRLEKGEINRDQYERGLAFALQRYNQSGGAGSNAIYSPWASTKAVDLQELVSKYGKEITPQTIARDLGYKYDPSTGIITDSSNKTVTLSPERIKNTIISRIMSNPEAMSYLKERQQLGLTNNIMEDLDKLGNEGALTFYRNDVENKTNYDFGLFKKLQDGSISSSGMNADAQTQILSLPWLASDNLADIAKNGLPKRGNTYIPGSYMPGALSSYGTSFQTDDLVESNKAKEFANQAIDKEYEYLKTLNPNITREDVLKWEDNYAKSNKTTAAFKYVPKAMYEEKYKQDIDELKTGSLPGSVQDWYIDGETVEDQKDFHKAIGFSDDNKVKEVSTAFAANGAMAAFIIMEDGKKYQAVRKPIESDQSKFIVANTLFNKYYDNSRGEITFTDPITGLPIKMEKAVGPNGMEAMITMSLPKYNNRGQIIGYTEQQRLPFNSVIEKLTPLVLEQKYVSRERKLNPSYGGR